MSAANAFYELFSCLPFVCVSMNNQRNFWGNYTFNKQGLGHFGEITQNQLKWIIKWLNLIINIFKCVISFKKTFIKELFSYICICF